MKPDSGQQLSQRAAFGADTLLGRQRKHSNQASWHINEKLNLNNIFIPEAMPKLLGMPTFHSLALCRHIMPAHKAKMEMHTL
jgi:hypothetical protein